MTSPLIASCFDIISWNEIEADIAELTLLHSISLEEAIGFQCREKPEQDTNALLLAVISYSTSLDEIVGTIEDEDLHRSLHRYKVAAILAADIALLGPEAKRCGDLLRFWTITKNFLFFEPTPPTQYFCTPER